MRPVDLPGAYLVLDLGNDCPLACRHCIHSEADRHPQLRTRGCIDPALVERVLDELEARQRRFHALILFWLGEPLLHPQFEVIHARAAAAVRAGVFRRLEVHTNAVALTRERARAICAPADVPQRWHLSLDAASPFTYTRVKGRDHYWAVQRNARALLEERAAADNNSLDVVFQFIPQPDNAAEARAFVQRWQQAAGRFGRDVAVVARAVPEGIGDAVFFRQLDALRPERQPAADRLFARVVRQAGVERARGRLGRWSGGLRTGLRGRFAGRGEPAPACACPFLSPVIHHGGALTVCTRDSALTLSPGTLADGASFHELWFESAALDALRDAQLAGRATGLCRDCPIPRSANYTGLDEAARSALTR